MQLTGGGRVPGHGAGYLRSPPSSPWHVCWQEERTADPLSLLVISLQGSCQRVAKPGGMWQPEVGRGKPQGRRQKTRKVDNYLKTHVTQRCRTCWVYQSPNILRNYILTKNDKHSWLNQIAELSQPTNTAAVKRNKRCSRGRMVIRKKKKINDQGLTQQIWKGLWSCSHTADHIPDPAATRG